MSMYNETLIIRMSKEMKDNIKKKARENYQTASDYVRSLIVKDLKGSK